MSERVRVLPLVSHPPGPNGWLGVDAFCNGQVDVTDKVGASLRGSPGRLAELDERRGKYLRQALFQVVEALSRTVESRCTTRNGTVLPARRVGPGACSRHPAARSRPNSAGRIRQGRWHSGRNLETRATNVLQGSNHLPGPAIQGRPGP